MGQAVSGRGVLLGMAAGGPSLLTRQRQLDEIDALQCMYCDAVRFEVLTAEESVKALRGAVEAGDAAGLGATQDVALSVALELAAANSADVPAGTAVPTVCLHMTLPPQYPDEAAEVTVASCSLSRAHTSSIRGALQAAELPGPGEEQLMEAVQVVTAAFEAAAEAEAAQADAPPAPTSHAGEGAGVTVGRVLVWFHHIRSPSKKASITDWAAAAGLRGLCKPGSPGVLYAEGEQGALHEYVAALRSLRWKAMALRGEEWGEVPSVEEGCLLQRGVGTWSGTGVDMLQPDALGTFAAAMEAIGRGEWFKRCILKMGP